MRVQPVADIAGVKKYETRRITPSFSDIFAEAQKRASATIIHQAA